jgi:hypothetical protein
MRHERCSGASDLGTPVIFVLVGGLEGETGIENGDAAAHHFGVIQRAGPGGNFG